MRITKKRILCILLAALMLAATSCGGETTSNETEAVQETAAETVAETEPDYLEQYAGTDFGGANYTFTVHSEEMYPNYVGDSETGEPVNDTQFQRDVWIESTYNTNIEYMVYPNSNDIVKAVKPMVVAGDSTIDFVTGDMANCMKSLTNEGLMRNLLEVPGLDLEADWWSQSMNREFTIAGKLFTTTGPMTFGYYYAPRLVAFNQKLATDYNIEDLYTVVEEGRWTLDYMASTMESVKTDLNGDGEYGEDDRWGASVDEYSAAGFYISAGGTQISVDKDGKATFLFDLEQNYSIIEKVASIIGNEDMTQKAEELGSRTGSYSNMNKVYTFKNGNALYLGYGAQAIAIYLRDMEDNYGIIPVPKLDENQSEYITFGSAFVPSYAGMPLNNNRDDVNGILLNTFGYISQRDLQPVVATGTLKGKGARDEESQKMIDIIYKDVTLDLNSCYNFGGSFTLLRDVTMGKKENFVSNFEKLQKSANAELEKLLATFLAADAE